MNLIHSIDKEGMLFVSRAQHPLHTERLLVTNGLGSEARRPVNEAVRPLINVVAFLEK